MTATTRPPGRQPGWSRIGASILLSSLAWSFDGRHVGASGDVAVDAGEIVVVDDGDRSRELDHGDQGTTFAVRLPVDATCPGDSANDQWRVQSFLIPATDDPTEIVYGPIGPDPVGDGRYALFGIDTVPYVHELTVRNPGPGRPGQIPLLPLFSFAVVAGEEIPDDRYRIGVACTYFGATSKYWDTEIVITGSTGEEADELEWRLASAPADVGRSSTGFNAWAVVGIGGFGLLAYAAFRQLRAGNRALTPSKESS